MEHVSTLRKYGLFDAKVPRYTSYPPANRFKVGLGEQVQTNWLATLPPDEPVSLYVHIPFCRRLCWFCACRTQGTQTLSPVKRYMMDVEHEIETVSQVHLPPNMSMARLHLGGGTPTLLNSALMSQLLNTIESRFDRAKDYEFSVEIDPTEAKPGVLKVLADHNMTRASVGVQDFNPEVQQAIGREQSFETTRDVIDELRKNGVDSLNIDFLYGLPYQTEKSLLDTIDQVAALKPDRLALYGYAHVPHVSKRQVMIPDDALPNTEERFAMAQIAKERLLSLGYLELGIDHFALPDDSLAKAAANGTMTRNFQGYTDDPCATLVGFGASAISRFPQGYLQNAVSTSVYSQRVQTNGRAGHKGYELSDEDKFYAELIDGIMCRGEISPARILGKFPSRHADLRHIIENFAIEYAGLLGADADGLKLSQELMPAARLIAAKLDGALDKSHIHSVAI